MIQKDTLFDLNAHPGFQLRLGGDFKKENMIIPKACANYCLLFYYCLLNNRLQNTQVKIHNFYTIDSQLAWQSYLK